MTSAQGQAGGGGGSIADQPAYPRSGRRGAARLGGMAGRWTRLGLMLDRGGDGSDSPSRSPRASSGHLTPLQLSRGGGRDSQSAGRPLSWPLRGSQLRRGGLTVMGQPSVDSAAVTAGGHLPSAGQLSPNGTIHGMLMFLAEKC